MLNFKEDGFYMTDVDVSEKRIFELGQWGEPLEVETYSVVGPLGCNPPEATFTMKMTKEQYFRMIDTFTGLFKMICAICPNKRVIHLAVHGKKRKTRKKNRNRAVRILEKEAMRHA